MTGILSDQPVTRTDEFEGRTFAVRQGAEQEYWQCDRCSRSYATVLAAARCANPNHSQLFGPRPERHAEPDLAAKANGGRRVGDDDTPDQAARRGRPVKYATDAERHDAKAGQTRERNARVYAEKVAEKREAWQDHVAAVQEALPANGRVTRWTDEHRKKHAEAMRRHHEQRRAAKAAADPTPPPEKEAPVPEHVNGRNKIEWTPERRAAHGELMKRKAAERKGMIASLERGYKEARPKAKPKTETAEPAAPQGVAMGGVIKPDVAAILEARGRESGLEVVVLKSALPPEIIEAMKAVPHPSAARCAPRDADPVDHPAHYTAHPSGVECIQITEHMNFCLGNAMKYLWRAGQKGSTIEDLKKARWYIEREIARLGTEVSA